MGIDLLIKDELDLRKDTEMWDAFIEPPIPIFFYFYFFHVLNPDEYQSGASAKPVVKQTGPYVFDEVRNVRS